MSRTQFIDEINHEASLFAILLLVPESLLRKELGDHPQIDIADDGWIGPLAKKFGVSHTLMLIRILMVYRGLKL